MQAVSCPIYLQESSDIQELLSQHLKGWAFTVPSDLIYGRVTVHHRNNVAYVRKLLDKHGFEHIRVACY